MRIVPTTMPPRATAPQPAAVSALRSSTEASTASFATNPKAGGMPAIEAPATTAAANGHGSRRHRPDRSRRSRVPALRSMMPTTRNSVDLKSAWATTIARPATAADRVPIEAIRVRNPSWLTVP